MAFSRALGGGSADDGIRVVAINPGPVSTGRLVGLMRGWAEERFGDAEEWPKLAEPMPFGRPATPEEIGHMAAFLASDLSAYTSGTVVSIDGGGVHRGGML
jgi:NAD(P)-dependent dehydrogenase (short-subunit alcohol dehydrogenase family)